MEPTKKPKGINWKLRAKNVLFWLGVAATVASAVGLDLRSFASWPLLWAEICNLLSSPFRVGLLLYAIIAVIADPTTPGLRDSLRALSRKKLGDD